MCRCPTDAPAEHKSSRSTTPILNSHVWANTAKLNQCELDKGTLDAPLCSKHFTGKAEEDVETKTSLLQECTTDPKHLGEGNGKRRNQAATNKTVLIFTQIMAASISSSSYTWAEKRIKMQRPEMFKHCTHSLLDHHKLWVCFGLCPFSSSTQQSLERNTHIQHQGLTSTKA